ncbi:MAG TPA: hypothetical protein VFF67_10165 [Thermoplasmata archaeon]|nr:hypothetical protein [Thermoplasmata archaeon]
MRIYIASSWSNVVQPIVVQLLRDIGHEVYDFRHPAAGDDGFHWRQVGLEGTGVGRDELVRGLSHPLAEAGFEKDFGAMQRADVCVLVLPCGRSAHAEAGWFAGQGRPVHVVWPTEDRPDLMLKMFTAIHRNLQSLVEALDLHNFATVEILAEHTFAGSK